MRKQIDLTTLPGWANLSSGNHTIKIKAKGTGYIDSELSTGVTVSKAAQLVTLSAGTYKFVDSPTFTSSFNETVSYTSNGVDWDKLRVNGFQNIITYGIPNTNVYVNHSWSNTAYQTITLATDQQVSAEFYKWAITDGNLVKQQGETWVLNLAEDLTESNQDFASLNFTSNSESFVRILRQYDNRPTPPVNSLLYYKSDGTYVTGVYTVDDLAYWSNQAYRTITFATPPTGDLLTWLQANGTKQS